MNNIWAAWLSPKKKSKKKIIMQTCGLTKNRKIKKKTIIIQQLPDVGRDAPPFVLMHAPPRPHACSPSVPTPVSH